MHALFVWRVVSSATVASPLQKLKRELCRQQEPYSTADVSRLVPFAVLSLVVVCSLIQLTVRKRRLEYWFQCYVGLPQVLSQFMFIWSMFCSARESGIDASAV